MNWRRWLMWGLVGLLGVLVIIQFVPYGRAHENPPVIAEPAGDRRTRLGCDGHS
jgi:hypothetical protein